MKKLGRIVESPLLLGCSLVVSALLTFGWYRANASLNAPDIPGYRWAQHRNVLLISYVPDNCGCSGSPFNAATMALNNRKDVVVVSQRDAADLKPLKSFLPARLSVFTNAQAGLIQRLSPHGKTAFILIQDGRVVRRVEGGLPAENFWR